MKVINLTDHDVNVCDYYGNIITTYEPSGKEARVTHGYKTVGYINGFPLVERVNEHLTNLPEPQEGVVYIVSHIVLNYCKDRKDLIAPTEQVTRYGRVIGCQSFMSNR